MTIETCNIHALVEEKMRNQAQFNTELQKSISLLHRTLILEIQKLNAKVEVIHNKLVGDISSEDEETGQIQKVRNLEKDNLIFAANQAELQDVIKKIVPWFIVFKWTVITVAPVLLLGSITLAVGLLTGKIQIIM